MLRKDELPKKPQRSAKPPPPTAAASLPRDSSAPSRSSLASSFTSDGMRPPLMSTLTPRHPSVDEPYLVLLRSQAAMKEQLRVELATWPAASYVEPEIDSIDSDP
jgi:hypothetical protein